VLHSDLCLLSDSLRADGHHHLGSQCYHYFLSKFCLLNRASEMRKTNYSFEKRQREIAKQKKKEAKRLKKTDKADQSDKEEDSKDVI